MRLESKKDDPAKRQGLGIEKLTYKRFKEDIYCSDYKETEYKEAHANKYKTIATNQITENKTLSQSNTIEENCKQDDLNNKAFFEPSPLYPCQKKLSKWSTRTSLKKIG